MREERGRESWGRGQGDGKTRKGNDGKDVRRVIVYPLIRVVPRERASLFLGLRGS
jgi:hypothetical protein